MKAVIMAGGQGSRFWPWSTSVRPKQFLSLRSNQTLIQETFERFHSWLPAEKIYVVTTEEYLSTVKKQLPLLLSQNIIVEPERKDTAPCIALTSIRFLEMQDDEVIVTAPSDQYIDHNVKFKDTLELAGKAASEFGNIITIGIRPNRPETGYGYIEADLLSQEGEILPVRQFIEKPSLSKAEELILEKRMYWNSGIFIWRPSTIAFYMKTHQEELWNTLNNKNSNLKEAYGDLPKISVDYAILEKADKVFMVPASFEWDDIGTWGSLERFQAKDLHDNLIKGKQTIVTGNNCTVISETKKTIVIGLDDIIVVETDAGLLVCHKSQEQKIKEELQKLDDKKEE
ncbi:mannose-1-phosphate guanylyltransferase [Fictibacillus fluitans]|uniref:Sugar phosphate nucleotidyltransferase n=1 Tax=Fictibacillus fluitans TaxID=3058422 RepID=A0ABT8HS99_9BACL|nr:sugar phosphate nucleotidyltransferase [Fictibacillus sp. NE201]MDN4523621.1 sugar phosphate nucleotidyltransferase [Fictibacillus sp. NE201]